MVASPVYMPEGDVLWRLTMEHSPVGMAIVTPAGDVLSANAALCDLLGLEPDAVDTMRFADLCHPDDRDVDQRQVARCLAGEISSYRVTRRCLRGDGSSVVGDVAVALLRAPDGTPIHFIVQVVTVADLHQSAAEAVLETVAVGLLLVDADGSFRGHNARMQEFMDLAFPSGHPGRVGATGFLYDAQQARPLTSEETPSRRAAAGEAFDECLVWVGEDEHTRRALSVSARSVRDGRGVLTGAVLAYQDVTELVRALRAKDDFVTHVSHELRTPLTSAMAHLELMDDSDDLGPALRKQVTAVRRNVARLSHLVADLLYATRATVGSSLIDPYRVDVVTVVAEALDAARVEAAVGSVTLEAELPDSLMAHVDGIRLRQAVDNIVGNAIAFAPRHGHVAVTLDADETGLVLTVGDDGEGIDPEDVPHVFDRFFRGRNAERLHVRGAGLGLDIVRTVVEAHHGEVSVQSAVGVGTRVRVALPR